MRAYAEFAVAPGHPVLKFIGGTQTGHLGDHEIVQRISGAERINFFPHLPPN